MKLQLLPKLPVKKLNVQSKRNVVKRGWKRRKEKKKLKRINSIQNQRLLS